MESYNIWPFVIHFFHWTWCFQGSCCSKDQYLSILNCQMIPHCVHVWHSSIYQLVDTSGLFSLFNYYYQCWYEHLCTHFCSGTCYSFSWVESGIELLGHKVILDLIFWRTDKLFSKAAAAFYNPTSIVHGFQFFLILTNACYFCLF